MAKKKLIISCIASALLLGAGGTASALGIGDLTAKVQREFSTERCSSYFNDGDVFHDQAAEYISNIEPTSTEDVTVRVKVKHGQARDVSVAYTFDYNSANPSYFEAPMEFESVDPGLKYDYWVGAIPHNEAPYQYHFVLRNDVDTVFYNIDGIGEGALRNSSSDWSIRPNFKTPSWSKGATWYSVMPESYYNADTLNDKTGQSWDSIWGGFNTWAGEWFGGDLSGINSKEDYLYNTLNVTSLFMNPIWATNHNAGYGSYDFFQIDSSLGDDAELLKLVASLHEDEMTIMLDAVFQYCNVNNIINNISELYPDLLGDLYYNFGQRDAAGNQINSVWGGVIIDFSHKIARDYLYSTEQSVILSYIIFFGIDAWRMDVGNDLTGSDRNNWGTSDQILADIREYIKAVSDEVLFLSEHAGAGQLTNGILDSKWNYAFNTALTDWCQNASNSKVLDTGLRNATLYYPRGVTLSLYNFLTTHDQEYFFERIDRDKTSFMSAQILLMTFIGSPCIYMGEEYGQTSKAYVDNIDKDLAFYSSMNWDYMDYDYDIYNLNRSLGNLRKDLSNVFTTGGTMTLFAQTKDNDDDLYSYARFNDDVAITTVNRNSTWHKDFTLDVSRLGLKNGTVLYDYLTNKSYVVKDGYVTFDVAPYGSVLTNKSNYSFVGGLVYEGNNAEYTRKVGDYQYVMSGEASMADAGFAYRDAFGNSSIIDTVQSLGGSFLTLYKDADPDSGAFYGVKVLKGQMTCVSSVNGAVSSTKTIRSGDEIEIVRDDDNVFKTYLNGTLLTDFTKTVEMSFEAKAGVSNLSGTNEHTIMFEKNATQRSSDFENGSIGSWCNVDGNASISNGDLHLSNAYVYGPVSVTDFTFKAEVKSPSVINGYCGIHAGMGNNDFAFVGFVDEGVIAVGQTINGKFAEYGRITLNSTEVTLQIEKTGTTYTGIVFVDGEREYVGTVNANYSSLSAGVVAANSEAMSVHHMGYGDLAGSLTDYSTDGEIDFSIGAYKDSTHSLKYKVIKGSSFEYTNGGIKVASCEEETSYGFASSMKDISATFNMTPYESKDSSSYMGFIFGADSSYENGYLVKVTNDGTLTVIDPLGATMGSKAIAGFAEGSAIPFNVKVSGAYIHIYVNHDLFLSFNVSVAPQGTFAWVSSNYSYELRNYGIYKPSSTYINYAGETYLKEKNGDVTIELSPSSSTNYFGMRDVGVEQFNVGFNLQMERISPIKRGYFHFGFGSSVGTHYLSGVVFRISDQGKVTVYEDGVKLIDNQATALTSVSSAFINMTYQNGRLIVLAKAYQTTDYITLVDLALNAKHGGCFNFYTSNSTAKLNHIKGYGIKGDTDVRTLSSYIDSTMEQPVPANPDPVKDLMTSTYRNEFNQNSDLATIDRYSGQTYIDEGCMVLNSVGAEAWTGGATIASGTFNNFRLTTRMKVSETGTSGGFAGIVFHKSSSTMTHEGTGITITMYESGYIGMYLGNAVMVSGFSANGVKDAQGFINLTLTVNNGIISIDGGQGGSSVAISALPRHNDLTSGFISLNAGCAVGMWDYVQVEVL